MGLEKTEGYHSGEHFAAEVIAALEKSRWGVAKPVPLLFYLYLPTEEAARACAEAIKPIGLEVQVDPSAADDGTWLCLSKAKMIPERARLTEIGNLLLSLAKEKNGKLDGWDTDLMVALKKGCFRIILRLVILLALLVALIYWLLKK